ncbi:MAG: LysM peptidoglycan-binding domain-containing protein [Lachnospiraceae bacterium]|nr:LysM peptidoglycan-binding domain-containing protein [Lachnospiraceae bacterium]
MKKITNRMISFAFLMCMGLFLFSLRVNAANNVTTINASGDTQGATISGTTDADVVAVLIEVLDGTDVVTLETHAVTSGEYTATLACTLDEGKTYTAYVVNYNGSGEPKTTTFSIPISVTGITMSPTTGTLTTAGSTLQLTATVSPSNATNPAVTWSSGNTSVATVDATGKVTAVANGTATITVKTTDGNKTATATITVTISGTGDNGSTEDNGGTGDSGSTGDNGSTGDSGSIGDNGSTGDNGGTGNQGNTNASTDNKNSSSGSAVKEEKVSVPIEYVVVKGDTLGRIARRNQMTLRELLTLNPQIKNPNLIRPGQRIVIGYTEKTVASETAEENTDIVYYIVKRGDSLYKIARINKLSFTQLIALNPEVMGRRYIYPGQKIRVK